MVWQVGSLCSFSMDPVRYSMALPMMLSYVFMWHIKLKGRDISQEIASIS